MCTYAPKEDSCDQYESAHGIRQNVCTQHMNGISQAVRSTRGGCLMQYGLSRENCKRPRELRSPGPTVPVTSQHVGASQRDLQCSGLIPQTGGKTQQCGVWRKRHPGVHHDEPLQKEGRSQGVGTHPSAPPATFTSHPADLLKSMCWKRVLVEGCTHLAVSQRFMFPFSAEKNSRVGKYGATIPSLSV